MQKIPKMPDILEKEPIPPVTQLLEVIQYQGELIQGLRNELAILKGNKPKPVIKPSGMEKGKKEGEKT